MVKIETPDWVSKEVEIDVSGGSPSETNIVANLARFIERVKILSLFAGKNGEEKLTQLLMVDETKEQATAIINDKSLTSDERRKSIAGLVGLETEWTSAEFKAQGLSFSESIRESNLGNVGPNILFESESLSMDDAMAKLKSNELSSEKADELARLVGGQLESWWKSSGPEGLRNIDMYKPEIYEELRRKTAELKVLADIHLSSYKSMAELGSKGALASVKQELLDDSESRLLKARAKNNAWF